MRPTIRIKSITSAIIMLCTLPYATGDNLLASRELNTAPGRAIVDLPVATPLRYFDLSRELNVAKQRDSVIVPAWPSAEALAFSHDIREINVKAEPAGFGISVAASMDPPLHKVHSRTPAQQIDPEIASHAHAAIFSPPQQLAANVDRISFDTPTLAPMAFVRFCMRYPKECAVHHLALRSEPVALTKARKSELEKINRDINRAIKPQKNLYGVMMEDWLLAPGAGDCNDYAVTKRHKLLALGWPSRSLLLAEVILPSGEHHLILVVRTREEDFVLDNLNQNIRPVSQIHYQWVRAQQPKNSKFWSMVSVTHGNRVATNGR